MICRVELDTSYLRQVPLNSTCRPSMLALLSQDCPVVARLGPTCAHASMEIHLLYLDNLVWY